MYWRLKHWALTTGIRYDRHQRKHEIVRTGVVADKVTCIAFACQSQCIAKLCGIRFRVTGARGAGLILGGNLGSLTFYVCLSYKMKLVPQTVVSRTYILHRRGAVVIGAHRVGVKERASSAWQYISHAYAHLLRCKCYVTEARSTHLPSAIVTF